MNLTDLLSDVSFLSSIAIILGTVFVVFQLRQNSRLIFAAKDQAEAAAVQAKLTTEQLKQNNEIVNTAEVQSDFVEAE